MNFEIVSVWQFEEFTALMKFFVSFFKALFELAVNKDLLELLFTE